MEPVLSSFIWFCVLSPPPCAKQQGRHPSLLLTPLFNFHILQLVIIFACPSRRFVNQLPTFVKNVHIYWWCGEIDFIQQPEAQVGCLFHLLYSKFYSKVRHTDEWSVMMTFTHFKQSNFVSIKTKVWVLPMSIAVLTSLTRTPTSC